MVKGLGVVAMSCWGLLPCLRADGGEDTLEHTTTSCVKIEILSKISCVDALSIQYTYG
jgi:hypothetical protein